MQWDLVATDLNSRNRAFLTDWDNIDITRRIGGYCEATFHLQIYDRNATEIQIAQRAVKFYRGNVLRLYGTIWEPLLVNHPNGITVVCRDPYAYFPWRRNRTLVTYTTTDAGSIVASRLSAQNGFSNTHLRMGAIQTSVNRTITVNPGKMESELIEDLAGMSQGYFFRVDPVDGVGGTFAEIVILYPNAGTTREGVRFEYGGQTKDNLTESEITYMMPRNREVAASSAATGGRITGIVEDTGSQGIYGIIEDEISVSDISDTTILSAFAGAEIYPTPPTQYKITPNANSPLLFQDFDAGDFVRLIVKDGADNLSTFVRVVEATMSVDKDGVETMKSMTVEAPVGSKSYGAPEDLFRDYLDEMRARQEMLDRKVQNISATVTAPAASGGGGTTSAPPPPSDPTPVSGPPPAPDQPPVISGLSAYPGPDRTSQQIGIDLDVAAQGLTTNVSIKVERGGFGGTLVQIIDGGNGGDRHVGATVNSLSRNTTYYITAFATNSAGQVSATTTAATLSSDLF